MLENKIAELTAQITALIEVLKANGQQAQTAQPPQAARQLRQPSQAEESVPPSPAPAPAKAKVKAEPESGVSIDMLRDICVNIVRDEPDKKAVVKELIATFGGALKVQDVPVSDRQTLLSALEKL
jgi:hypothetical protein